jgi:hypothetical protein
MAKQTPFGPQETQPAAKGGAPFRTARRRSGDAAQRLAGPEAHLTAGEHALVARLLRRLKRRDACRARRAVALCRRMRSASQRAIPWRAGIPHASQLQQHAPASGPAAPAPAARTMSTTVNGTPPAAALRDASACAGRPEAVARSCCLPAASRCGARQREHVRRCERAARRRTLRAAVLRLREARRPLVRQLERLLAAIAFLLVQRVARLPNHLARGKRSLCTAALALLLLLLLVACLLFLIVPSVSSVCIRGGACEGGCVAVAVPRGCSVLTRRPLLLRPWHARRRPRHRRLVVAQQACIADVSERRQSNTRAQTSMLAQASVPPKRAPSRRAAAAAAACPAAAAAAARAAGATGPAAAAAATARRAAAARSLRPLPLVACGDQRKRETQLSASLLTCTLACCSHVAARKAAATHQTGGGALIAVLRRAYRMRA